MLLNRPQKIQHLGPAIDFYKKLALDCSAQQIAVDLFFINAQYADISTIGQLRVWVYAGGRKTCIWGEGAGCGVSIDIDYELLQKNYLRTWFFVATPPIITLN